MVKKYFIPVVFSFIVSFAFGQNDSLVPQRRVASVIPYRPFQQNQDTTKRINPTNGYDLNKLQQLEQSFDEQFTQLRQEAEEVAKNSGLPIRYSLPDGGVAELRRLAPDGTPLYYRTYNADAAISTRTNYLNTGGGLGLDLNGDNLTAHVWDGGHARVSHQEYDGTGGTNRVTLMDTGSEGGTQLNFHAAHVTGTICASGVQSQAKGMAWQSDVRGYMWNNDVSEATSQAGATGFNNDFGMLVSNHSYGYDATSIPDAWFGQYGSDARAWDLVMNNAPYYLMLVAAGNDGNDNSSNGAPLAGQTAFDKLNGHATAKNNLVVANGTDATIDGSGNLVSVSRNTSSSEGPTDDYRIKPDIMGNGTGLYSTYETSNTAYGTISGTSMATPNVTGSLLLLQEHYYNLHGTYMRAASLKGLALHTADDAGGITGPDAQFGWGLLNAKKAAETLTDAAGASGNSIVEELTLNPGQTYQITVQSNGVDPLMASISWNDPAHATISGTNNTTPALVNDLDLRLDNGSIYYPWRLTGVNSNSNAGDNDVDPFERVDIAGASGTYTLTVTHEGSLNGNNPQDFTLIVTGVVVASTPMVSFGTTSDTIIEDSNCGFTDISIPVNIALGPSQSTDVNFSVNGSSTASDGLDFELLTSNVNFPAGSTTGQSMTLRVYHDGIIEGDETVIIDLSVNANGGDAVADTNANTFTLTINNDDQAPTSTFTSTVFYEDFNDVTGWLVIDADGDGNNWGIVDATGIHNYDGNIAISYSWNGSAFSPDNYLISPQFTIPAGATSSSISYEVGSATDPTFYREHYSVYFTTDISSTSTITSGTVLENDREIPAMGSETRSHNVTALQGQTGYFVIRHHNVTDEWWLGFDNLLVESTFETNVQTAVNTSDPDEFLFNDAGTAYSVDNTSGNVMAQVVNNNTFDYGCLSVEVSRAGIGAQSYNGSSLPNFVTNKTFTLTPANTTGSGNTTISFYFEEAEIAGWEAATGLSRTNLVAARGSATNVIETSSLTEGSFGTHVTLTGNFSGLDGTFYFGPIAAFTACSGAAKVWNGSSWSPGGAPTAVNSVVINGNYNTATNGNIDACVLTVNSGFSLVVTANNYVQVDGNITVEGTLIVEHQGNLVQVNDAAVVTNNGTIEVRTTSPTLASRDFMVLGSPMTSDTRQGVWNSAFLVLYHDTNNFLPNPDVAAALPGAENFADDNYDNWIAYPSGAITPGEGYIVRPQSGFGQPGGIFNYTYTSGTLNNGEVQFPIIYNNIGTPAENKNASPNILANPYASAIYADDFLNTNSMIDAVYFWEHLTPPSPSIPGAGAMNFDMQDISMYNLSGGLPAGNDPGTSTQPNGYISTSQGFGVKASAGGTAVFNNSMRRTSGNTTLRGPESIGRERLWIRVSQSEYELQSTSLIAFTENTTAGLDDGYDSRRLATVLSLYSHLEDGSQELGIQSREAFTEDKEVPFGFSTLVQALTQYKIDIYAIDGLAMEEASIYLVDNLTGAIVNLKEQAYEFNSGPGVFHNRFTVLFEKEEALGIGSFGKDAIAVYPNPTNSNFNIVSPQSLIESVQVIDIQGRMVKEAEVNKLTANISLDGFGAAVYFVRIKTSDGTVTKQIVKH